MDYLIVFAIGGIICTAGQILMDATKLTPAHILVIFVTAGAILTGIGWYEPLAEFAKNGATVPLPGFGYALAKGAMEEVDQTGLLGAFTGGVQNTSAGIAAAVVFGYFISVIFSSKSKS